MWNLLQSAHMYSSCNVKLRELSVLLLSDKNINSTHGALSLIGINERGSARWILSVSVGRVRPP